jgi:hypothetical protein
VMEGRREERFRYQIEVLGQVDAEDLNAMSPLQIQSVRVNARGQGNETTLFSVCSDQSGFIGLLRHLHARGLVLLCVQRLEGESND